MSEELVVKVPPEAVKKPGFCMIQGNPCKITELTNLPKATANGNKRLRLVGNHIFTGKKYEDTLNLTAGVCMRINSNAHPGREQPSSAVRRVARSCILLAVPWHRRANHEQSVVLVSGRGCGFGLLDAVDFG